MQRNDSTSLYYHDHTVEPGSTFSDMYLDDRGSTEQAHLATSRAYPRVVPADVASLNLSGLLAYHPHPMITTTTAATMNTGFSNAHSATSMPRSRSTRVRGMPSEPEAYPTGSSPFPTSSSHSIAGTPELPQTAWARGGYTMMAPSGPSARDLRFLAAGQSGTAGYHTSLSITPPSYLLPAQPSLASPPPVLVSQVPQPLQTVEAHNQYIPPNRVPCEWDGGRCGVGLDDISAGGIERHLAEYHLGVKGKRRVPGTCLWGAGTEVPCGRSMQHGNMGKHIASMHLRSSALPCPDCHNVFVRKDVLKKHRRMACKGPQDHDT